MSARRCGPRGAAVLVLLTTIALASSAAGADPAPLEIAAVDGLVLRATYYGAAAPGPGVLLLHQCNRERSSWVELATVLADAGMHVLTLDFRGFGESTGPGVRDFHRQRDELWPAFDDDVERALSVLQSLPDVDEERIGVMGASCGGSQALLLALRHPEVRAVGLLSSNLPWIESTDVDAFEENRSGAVAVLGIAAEEDAGSARVARRLFGGSRNAGSRLILYKGKLHGVPLFEEDLSLVPSIAAWFASALGMG